MVLTDNQKNEFLYGEANYQIPLAATKVNLWPRTIPYSMDSTIGMLLLISYEGLQYAMDCVTETKVFKITRRISFYVRFYAMIQILY